MKVIQLVIQMQEDGNIGLQGPLHNKPLCKALLAAGVQLVDEFREAPAVVPVAAIPGLARRP
jgi:hypothetical protein